MSDDRVHDHDHHHDHDHDHDHLTQGQLDYLQIPALDITSSAVFYREVFGWQVDPPDAGFEAPGLIGQWTLDRPASADAGMLAWIAVTDIEASLEVVRANGGTVLEAPTPDGPRLLATVSDPAGNAVGIFSHRPG